MMSPKIVKSISLDERTAPIANEKNNLATNTKYDGIKTKMLSKLLSHRIRHSERQMTNTKQTSDGPKISNGPSIRQIL